MPHRFDVSTVNLDMNVIIANFFEMFYISELIVNKIKDRMPFVQDLTIFADNCNFIYFPIVI